MEKWLFSSFLCYYSSCCYFFANGCRCLYVYVCLCECVCPVSSVQWGLNLVHPKIEVSHFTNAFAVYECFKNIKNAMHSLWAISVFADLCMRLV